MLNSGQPSSNLEFQISNYLIMSKSKKITYWIATVWLALGMVSTGLVQLLHVEDEVKNFENLGYPLYLMTILGAWKILGAIAILVPKFPLIKEWTYAGLLFLTTGAILSYVSVGAEVVKIFPALLLLILTVVSWYFRPETRKLTA
jgi:hypothetical protein